MELILNNIYKDYDRNIFNNISYRFSSGKIYGLLGNNGVGKTTLFNTIKGCVSYDGNILIDNNNVFPSDIGMVPAIPLLPEYLTGREFISFFLTINNINKSVDECLDLVDIENIDRDKLIKDYSLGMKSKLQLLSYLLIDVKVLLLDEPLTSLDLVSADEIKHLLTKIKKDKIIILSTHIMDIALSICDEIVILKDCNLIGIKKNNHIKEVILKEMSNN